MRVFDVATVPPALAAKLDLLADAERNAHAAESILSAVWRRILTALKRLLGFANAVPVARTVRTILAPAGEQIVGGLVRRMERTARRGYDSGLAVLRGLPPIPPRRPRLVTAAGGSFFQPPRPVILPNPTAAQIDAVLQRSGWREQAAKFTRLLDADEVALNVFRQTAAGMSINQVTADLLPKLDHARKIARRVARDTSLWIAHEMQFEAWGPVDDMIDGYRVNAVDEGHNPTSRPEHRARHGTIYYKRPAPGQKGLDEMPRPPFESPRDGSTLAYNCRCWISPVWSD